MWKLSTYILSFFAWRIKSFQFSIKILLLALYVYKLCISRKKTIVLTFFYYHFAFYFNANQSGGDFNFLLGSLWELFTVYLSRLVFRNSRKDFSIKVDTHYCVRNYLPKISGRAFLTNSPRHVWFDTIFTPKVIGSSECEVTYFATRDALPVVNSLVNPPRPKSYVYARWDIKSYHDFGLRASERAPRYKFHNPHFYLLKPFR